MVAPRLGQQVARGGIGLEPLGAEVKRFVQVLKALVWFAQHDIERGEVIPGFRLVGNEGDKFFDDSLKFDQVAHLGVSLGDEAGFTGFQMRLGQGMAPMWRALFPVLVLHLVGSKELPLVAI